MRITVSPADHTTDIDGVPVRLWTGTTESGIRVTLAVHALIVHKDDDASAFERELTIRLPPLVHADELESLFNSIHRD
jgi:hypothetical protein